MNEQPNEPETALFLRAAENSPVGLTAETSADRIVMERMASKGWFELPSPDNFPRSYLITTKGRAILNRILDNTP